MSFNFKKKELFTQEKDIQQKIQVNASETHHLQTNHAEEDINFSDFSLHQDIIDCLQRIGYEKPTKIQI